MLHILYIWGKLYITPRRGRALLGFTMYSMYTPNRWQASQMQRPFLWGKWQLQPAKGQRPDWTWSRNDLQMPSTSSWGGKVGLGSINCAKWKTKTIGRNARLGHRTTPAGAYGSLCASLLLSSATKNLCKVWWIKTNCKTKAQVPQRNGRPQAANRKPLAPVSKFIACWQHLTCAQPHRPLQWLSQSL